MKFIAPGFLWLCLLALIPWLIYLFQYLLAKSEKLPSLIFIQENKKLKQNPRRKLLVYLLQSLVLLIPGLLMAGPIASFAGDQFFCVADDLVHSQLSAEKIQQLKSRLNRPCQGKIYSLASLAQNRLEPLDPARPNRNELVYLQNTLLHWQDSIPQSRILLVMPENSYLPGLESALDKELSVSTFSLPAEKNLYFEQVSLLPHPTDFRKRELYIKLNTPAGANAQFLIERKKNKISALADDEGSYRQNITVDNEIAKEEFQVLLQGDSFIFDNRVSFVIQNERPFFYDELPAGLPNSIRAALEINAKYFPFLWFQKRPGGPYKIGYDSQLVASQVSFLKTGISQGPRNLAVNAFGAEHGVFSRLFIRDTYEFQSSRGADIALRYTDGTPAILKHDKGGGIFLFNPDSADERLLRNPAYPLSLLQAMIGLFSKTSSQVIQTESQRDVALPEKTGQPFEPGVVEKNQVSYLLQIHPQASSLSGKAYKETMLYSIEAEGSSFNAETILLSLLFILLIVLLIIDTQVNELNPVRGLVNAIKNRQ